MASSECVSKEIDAGKPQDQAVAICISKEKTAQFSINTKLLTSQIIMNNYSRTLQAKKKLA